MSITIQLRYFAGLREALGLSQEELPLPEQVQTVGGVRDFLMQRGGVWATELGGQRALRMAYDQQMAQADTPIADRGEVAFFPPVTGG